MVCGKQVEKNKQEDGPDEEEIGLVKRRDTRGETLMKDWVII